MSAELPDQRPTELPPDLPQTITYAVLTVDGDLKLKSVASRAELRDGDLYHHGPWDAAGEEIGGPCRSLDRVPIGRDLLAWVAGESLLRPDTYPPNEIGGRAVNILIQLGLEAHHGDRFWGIEIKRRWGGPIVVTSTESRGRWPGFIWPLDEEQRDLIVEAWRAARGDSSSMLSDDDLELDCDEGEELPLRWQRMADHEAVWEATGPVGDWWCAANFAWEQGDDPGPWTLARWPAETLTQGVHAEDLIIEGEFDTLHEALQAGQERAAVLVAASEG